MGPQFRLFYLKLHLVKALKNDNVVKLLHVTCLGETTRAKWGWKVLRLSVTGFPCFIRGNSSSAKKNSHTWDSRVDPGFCVEEAYRVPDPWRDVHFPCSVWEPWNLRGTLHHHHHLLPPQLMCCLFQDVLQQKKKISFYKMYAKSHEGSLTSKQTNTHYASGCLNQYSEIKHQLLMKGAEMSCENNESAPRQASSDEPHECQQNRGKRPCFPFSLYPWKAETWHTLQK